MPFPVTAPPPARPLDRAAYGLDPETFVFAFAFDHHSAALRKNPLGLIDAFSRAFAPGSGAALIVKSINARSDPEQARRIRIAAAAHADIRVDERTLPEAEKNALMAGCDCYASLHRAEGFGLTLAEAMAYGRPVIATAYGGNMDFMSAEDSYLVPHGWATLEEPVQDYRAGTRWAEPDLDAAARIMRAVFDDPVRAAERGRAAAARILSARSPLVVGRILDRELERARAEVARREPVLVRRRARSGPGSERRRPCERTRSRAENRRAVRSDRRAPGGWARSMRTLRYPPLHLRERVIAIDAAGEEDVEGYRADGERCARQIAAALPAGWDPRGRRVLDFGCGAGRVLRHMIDVLPGAELWGCDPHEESIEWLQAQAFPPLRAFVSGVAPPLPVPDATFDLVFGLSSLTHIGDGWAEWLLELRRVLKPDGLLVVTVLGADVWPSFGSGPWSPDTLGMLVFAQDNPAQEGGPVVFHSEWWLRSHWGRAFELLEVLDDAVEVGTRAGPFGEGLWRHGLVVARPRRGDLTAEELRAPEPGEHREHAAAEAQASVDASERMRDAVPPEVEELDLLRARVREQDAELDVLRARSAAYLRIVNGGWWRLRAHLLPVLRPLARLRQRLRAR